MRRRILPRERKAASVSLAFPKSKPVPGGSVGPRNPTYRPDRPGFQVFHCYAVRAKPSRYHPSAPVLAVCLTEKQATEIVLTLWPNAIINPWTLWGKGKLSMARPVWPDEEAMLAQRTSHGRFAKVYDYRRTCCVIERISFMCWPGNLLAMMLSTDVETWAVIETQLATVFKQHPWRHLHGTKKCGK